MNIQTVTGGVEVATPAKIEARMMPWAATIRVASWGFAVLSGLVIFYFGLVMGGIVPWLALPLTIGGLLIAAYCAWRWWGALRARKLDAPLVTIGPDGFHDARLGGVVPWCEIDNLSVDQPGTRTFLRIEARDPLRFVPRRTARRAARDGALIACLSELDVAPGQLVAAAEAYKAAS